MYGYGRRYGPQPMGGYHGCRLAAIRREDRHNRMQAFRQGQELDRQKHLRHQRDLAFQRDQEILYHATAPPRAAYIPPRPPIHLPVPFPVAVPYGIPIQAPQRTYGGYGNGDRNSYSSDRYSHSYSHSSDDGDRYSNGSRNSYSEYHSDDNNSVNSYNHHSNQNQYHQYNLHEPMSMTTTAGAGGLAAAGTGIALSNGANDASGGDCFGACCDCCACS